MQPPSAISQNGGTVLVLVVVTKEIQKPLRRKRARRYLSRVWTEKSILTSEWNHLHLSTRPLLTSRMNDVTGCYSNTSSTHLVRLCLFERDTNTLTTDDDIVTLPLWSPSVVEIGSVGYLRKPEGGFVTLFNAFDPPKTSDGVLKGMANLHGYGKVSEGAYRQDKRNRAQRGLDVLQSWLTSKSDTSVNFLRRSNLSDGRV